jgi:hypothetical protein
MRRIGRLGPWTAILPAIVVLAGCGSKPAAAPSVAIEDLPPAFVQTAKQRFPRVKFDEVFRKPDGTLEIRGREKNGKIRELQLRPDGTIIELE